LGAGFWIGRRALVVSERVRTTEGPAEEGGAASLRPVEEVFPDVPAFLPVRRDTVFVNDTVRIVERVDTAAIILDYAARRRYSELLFDRPDLGRLNVEFGVQYNRADSLRFSFVPVRTEATRYVRPSIEPFALVEYGTLGRLGIGGGAFYGKWGALVKFETAFSGQRGVGIGLAYRF
jgi:hypothetical protein